MKETVAFNADAAESVGQSLLIPAEFCVVPAMMTTGKDSNPEDLERQNVTLQEVSLIGVTAMVAIVNWWWANRRSLRKTGMEMASVPTQ